MLTTSSYKFFETFFKNEISAKFRRSILVEFLNKDIYQIFYIENIKNPFTL
jgi:uncharacterized membrane protein